MAHFSNCAVAAATSLVLLSAGCGRSVGNAAPRVTPVPAHTTAGGGAVFSANLAEYVSDAEGDPLTYQVTAGGGGFSGAIYSNQFDSLGTYTVQFSVSDPDGGSASSSFDVTVNTANLAVIPEGDNLRLLDTDTEQFLAITASTGFTETLRATLSTGHVVYQRTNGTERLFVFDPNTRMTSTLGNSATSDAVHATQTPDHRVVFTRAAAATPSDTDLFIWDSQSGLLQAISTAVGVVDGNPLVTSDSMVYYETGTPADVYRFDPTTNASTAITASANAETLRKILPNDGVVYSRVGAVGELDLFYYTMADGEVEVGLDLGATILGQTKTFRGSTTSNQIVFEVAGAADIDVYLWDPATAVSTAIAVTASVDELVVGVTALDEVVIDIETTPSNHDISVYSHVALSMRSVAATADNEVFEGSLSNGDLVVRTESGGGDTLSVYDTVTSSLASLAPAGSSLDAILENDKVVYTTAADVFVVNTTGAPAPVGVGGAGAVFAGEGVGGDFVVQTTVSAQLDLVLWDESAAASVTISSALGDDTFGVGLGDGDVLFLREDSGKSTTDLFLWDSATLAEKQLTDTTLNHAVSTVFTASSI